MGFEPTHIIESILIRFACPWFSFAFWFHCCENQYLVENEILNEFYNPKQLCYPKHIKPLNPQLNK
jgi:hypothetical protein